MNLLTYFVKHREYGCNIGVKIKTKYVVKLIPINVENEACFSLWAANFYMSLSLKTRMWYKFHFKKVPNIVFTHFIPKGIIGITKKKKKQNLDYISLGDVMSPIFPFYALNICIFKNPVLSDIFGVWPLRSSNFKFLASAFPFALQNFSYKDFKVL